MILVELREEEQFVSFIKGKGVIQFSASWCGPCKRMRPKLENFCHQNNVNMMYIDVDEFPEIANNYKITKLPTISIISNSQELLRFEGESEDLIFSKIKELL